MERKCCSCNKIKPIEYFKKKQDNTYTKKCKACLLKSEVYNRKNKDKINNYNKEYRSNNIENISVYYKEYCIQNKEIRKKKLNVYLKSRALYDSWYDKIDIYEECRQDPNDITLLQVKCTKCGEWFNPTTRSIINRIGCINGTNAGESRFYCSQECKDNCDIFHQVSWPKGLNPYSKREGSFKLRKIVLERDLQTCQKCYSKDNLECHHIIPVKIDKTLSNNPDNCITLCHICHMEAHSDYDCTTGYLANI